MDWQQKFAALKALTGGIGAAIHMRHPGNFYVSLPSVEIGNGHTLCSVSEGGETPEIAVEAMWRRLTERLLPAEVIVINAMTPKRKHVRWNGFMWQEIEQ